MFNGFHAIIHFQTFVDRLPIDFRRFLATRVRVFDHGRKLYVKWAITAKCCNNSLLLLQ